MALNHLFNKATSVEWSFDRDFGQYSEHIDVDLKGVRLKDVTVVLEDNGTQQRVKNKIKELNRAIQTKDYVNLVDKALIQAQLDVLQEVVSD